MVSSWQSSQSIVLETKQDPCTHPSYSLDNHNLDSSSCAVDECCRLSVLVHDLLLLLTSTLLTPQKVSATAATDAATVQAPVNKCSQGLLRQPMQAQLPRNGTLEQSCDLVLAGWGCQLILMKHPTASCLPQRAPGLLSSGSRAVEKRLRKASL